MMKNFKKFLSVFLAVLMIASIASISFSTFAASENIPIVFVGGRGTKLVDKDGKEIYNNGITDLDTSSYIQEQCKTILPLLAKAVLTNDYDEYCDALYQAIADVYEKIALNQDGEVDNGSYSPFTWSKEGLAKNVKSGNTPYNMYDYVFYYDWRLDPIYTASELNEYIDAVLEVTGASQVKIIGRCYGGNVVAAYLSEYGSEKIKKCIMYSVTTGGSIECGALFAGKMQVSGDSLSRYLSDVLEDGYINDLITATVNLYNVETGMKLPISVLTAIYDKVAENVLPRAAFSCYASFPSYWSMIDDRYYEDAKKMIFGGKEEEYAKFIEKIDYYHENVMVPLNDNLLKYEEQGTDIFVIAKYGKQLVPVVDQPDLLGDDTVELETASFGATCSTIGTTLSSDYISQREGEGLGSYISADKQVDTSTCLFPDYTWVIKDSAHLDFTSAIDELMLTIMNYDGRMSIYDNENYPQYLLQNEDKSLSPLTAENCNTTEEWNPNETTSFVKFVFAFLEFIINLFTNWISK